MRVSVTVAAHWEKISFSCEGFYFYFINLCKRNLNCYHNATRWRKFLLYWLIFSLWKCVIVFHCPVSGLSKFDVSAWWKWKVPLDQRIGHIKSPMYIATFCLTCQNGWNFIDSVFRLKYHGMTWQCVNNINYNIIISLFSARNALWVICQRSREINKTRCYRHAYAVHWNTVIFDPI